MHVKWKNILGLVLWAGAVLPWGANASPLNLRFPPAPDLFASGIAVQYSQGTLTMFGDVAQFWYVDPNSPYTVQASSGDPFGAGAFSLTASIDSNGQFSNGTLSVGGYISGLAGYGNVGGAATTWNEQTQQNEVSGNLLTGDLLEFGFQETNDGKLEFVFQVTGGDLAPAYGPKALIVITQIGNPEDWDGVYGFPGSFTNDFSGTNAALGDIGAVPEPRTGYILAGGLFLLIMARRKHVPRRPL